MADVYIMCGCPGSGKSTWLKNHVKPGSAIISRDAIRFSLLKEGDGYFDKEDEVCNILWDQINGALSDGRDVFVDQTSLTKKSRKYLFDHIFGYDKANAIWIDTDLETALQRNELRKNTKAYVPRGQVRRMFFQFREPTFDEGFFRIFRYKDGKMTMKERS